MNLSVSRRNIGKVRGVKSEKYLHIILMYDIICE